MIETIKGRIKIKIKCTGDILPEVVSISHGWAQANVNLLTDIGVRDSISGYPELKSLRCRTLGYPELKAIRCRIKKITDA